MIEPWILVARIAVALAAQPNFAFDVGRAAGVAECRAAAAPDEAAKQRGAQADRDFFRWTPEHETGNPRF